MTGWRRSWGAGLAMLALAVLALAGTAIAHDGHGSRRIVADAQVVAIAQNKVVLNIALYNSGMTGARLQGASAEGANVEAFQPISLPAGAIQESTFELKFEGSVPGIFTVILDFGAAGQGPVVVMP